MATKRSTRVKKKTWYQVIAPKIFNNALIGETTVFDVTTLKDRAVKINLMSLTNDYKHQNVNVTLVIDEIKGDKAVTTPLQLEMIAASVKRLIRRNREHIFDSFIVETKEGKTVKVKPLIITRSRANNSVVKAVRKATRNFIAGYAKKTEFEVMFRNIAFNKLQREIRENVNKIFPTRSAEIRMLKLERKKKADIVAEEEREESEKDARGEASGEQKPKQ